MDQLKSGDKPVMMSGPKFGEDKGWWSRFKQNRSNIILSIIGILIIAGGIYLYTSYRHSNQLLGPSDISQENSNGAVTPDQVNVNGANPANQNQPNQTNQPTQNQTATQVSGPKAEIVSDQNGDIVAKANKGAGVTHLARAAVKEYLNNHQNVAQSFSAEQRIYLEDYLTKQIGSKHVKAGQQLTFNENTVQNGIAKAQGLSQKQLQNLHKYVLLVPSLQS